MKIIQGLMIKDFLNVKNYMKIFILTLLIFVFFNTQFLTIFFPLCFGMVAISSFNYDDLTKANRFILTLPVSKKEMIRARYIYIFMMTLVGAILGFALTSLIQIVKQDSTFNIMQNLYTSAGAFIGMMLLQSFEIPVMYKYGAEKGRIFQSIGIILIMLTISGIATFLIKILNISLVTFLEILENYLVYIALIITAILYLVSYKLSIKIYKKIEV